MMAASFAPLGNNNDAAQEFWRDTSGLDVLRLAEDPVRPWELCDEGSLRSWELCDALHAAVLAALWMTDPRTMYLPETDRSTALLGTDPDPDNRSTSALTGPFEQGFGFGRGAS